MTDLLVTGSLASAAATVLQKMSLISAKLRDISTVFILIKSNGEHPQTKHIHTLPHVYWPLEKLHHGTGSKSL